MTLQELHNFTKHLLDARPDKASDVVCIPLAGGSFGGTPVVPVHSVSSGFDWDDNIFFIHPDKELEVVK